MDAGMYHRLRRFGAKGKESLFRIAGISVVANLIDYKTCSTHRAEVYGLMKSEQVLEQVSYEDIVLPSVNMGGFC